MTPGQALAILIVGTAALRLVWAAALGVGHDEAYHALFALRPDWSYYDHPPMVALVERAGLALTGGELTPLGLRLGFVLLFAGSTWLMARLTARLYGGWSGVLAALALNATAYYGLAAGAFALPDGPLLFFWLLTLDRLVVALLAPGRVRPWVGVGLALGGALLSKYHAVLLPIGTLAYLLPRREGRAWLGRLGPYLAVGLALILFSPVLYWNASHGWASFGFQAGRAAGGLRLRVDGLGAFLGGPVGYLLPWMWVFLVGAVWRRRRMLAGLAASPLPEADRFLTAHALPPLALFLAVSLVRPVLPHWCLVGFVPLFPLLGRDWAAVFADRPGRLVRRAAVLLALVWTGAGLFAAQARWGIAGSGAVGLDPTRDLVGWDQLAAALRSRGLVERPGTFVFTSSWYHSGHLAFALGRDAGPVLCYNASDAHAFAQWSRPEDWLGQDGILLEVEPRSTEPEVYERFFSRIEPLGTVPIRRRGETLRTVAIYRCVAQREPFPFDGRHPLQQIAAAQPAPGPFRR